MEFVWERKSEWRRDKRGELVEVVYRPVTVLPSSYRKMEQTIPVKYLSSIRSNEMSGWEFASRAHVCLKVPSSRLSYLSI